MPLVVDANVLFSAFIKNGKSAEVLANNAGELFAPEFILEEFYEHRKEILKKTKRSEEEFRILFFWIEDAINVVPKEEYQDSLELARRISPDPDDVPYLALALKLRIPIWSNDKKLKEQNEVRVYSTHELSL
jgi:predicted nucleic acid-binding protein